MKEDRKEMDRNKKKFNQKKRQKSIEVNTATV